MGMAGTLSSVAIVNVQLLTTEQCQYLGVVEDTESKRIIPISSFQMTRCEVNLYC
jgi:hypothetical protein